MEVRLLDFVKSTTFGPSVRVEQQIFVRDFEIAGEFLLHVSSLKANYVCLDSKAGWSQSKCVDVLSPISGENTMSSKCLQSSSVFAAQ